MCQICTIDLCNEMAVCELCHDTFKQLIIDSLKPSLCVSPGGTCDLPKMFWFFQDPNCHHSLRVKYL